MSIADIGRLLWDRDLIIALAALVVSLTLLRVYLRAVERSMMRPALSSSVPVEVPPAQVASSAPPTVPLEIALQGKPPVAAVAAVWRGPVGAAAVQVVAGLAYALTVTLAWTWIARQLTPDRQVAWQGLLLFTLFFAWPVVIAAGLVATISWRAMALVVLAYAVVLASMLAWRAQGTEATLPMIASGWWQVNGAATVLVLVFLARPIRAIGPIVAALTVAAALGVFATAHFANQTIIEWVGEVAGAIGLSGRWGGNIAGLVLFGVPGLVAAVLAFLALRLLGRLHRARWISDQSIQADAVWLTFAVLQAPAQLPYLGLVAFPAYKLVAWLGHRLLGPRTTEDATAPRLLLLRVFSLGARSGRLFDAFSRLWRYKGSIRLIAGPDLANATVEPHEFLDFLAGRLQRRFITGPGVLERRLTEVESRRDPDGRFRVASFYCHDDTWRMVLRRLAGDSDLVLMDLRGFAPANQGCVYELNALLDAVPLSRILLVVDGTTDEAFLVRVLTAAWSAIGPQSPNRSDPHPRVRLYRLAGGGVDRLVATLANQGQSPSSIRRR
jgi:hypothetical protein